MYVCTSEIVKKANKIVDLCGTRDPHRIAKELGVEILYYPFNRQRGAYKVIMRNRFMFIKDNLHPVMEKIVLLHELGHDSLHREEATQVGGFKEFNIFDMRDNRMEFEANVFASQIALPDDDFIELAERGYDTEQIARALRSDIKASSIFNKRANVFLNLFSVRWVLNRSTHLFYFVGTMPHSHFPFASVTHLYFVIRLPFVTDFL